MTALKFYDSLDKQEWNNLKDYSGEILLRATHERLTPFQHQYDTTGALITSAYVVYDDGNIIGLVTTPFTQVTDGTYDWIIYNGAVLEYTGIETELATGRAYLELNFDDNTTLYSEMFDVCDCSEVLGTELILNGDFTDVTGLIPDEWDNNDGVGTAWVDASSVPGICGMGATSPDQVYISQDVLTIGKLYVISFEIIGISGGWIYINNFENTHRWNSGTAPGTYTFIDYATSATFEIRGIEGVMEHPEFTIDNVSVTEIVNCEGFTRIEWWNTNDLCGTIYQDDYHNDLYFDAMPHQPFYDLYEENQEDKEKNISQIVQVLRKMYQLKIPVYEGLADDLAKLRLHDYVYVTFSDGNRYRAYDVQTSIEWSDDYVGIMTIQFRVDKCVKAGCGNNYTLSPLS